MRAGGHDHVVDDGGRKLDTEHARDREAPDVGVDDGDRLTLLRKRDSQVGGDRRLAYAALAGRNQQNAGAVTGLGERDRSALSVTMRSLRTGGGGGIAVQHLADLCPLLIGHYPEVDADEVDTIEGGNRLGDLALDLVAQGTPRDREVDTDLDMAAVDRGRPDHAEVDDAAMEFGILHRTQGVDDGGFGDGHGKDSRAGRSGGRSGANFSYRRR